MEPEHSLCHPSQGRGDRRPVDIDTAALDAARPASSEDGEECNNSSQCSSETKRLGERSRPSALRQLHDGLLGATSGGSSGSLHQLGKQATPDASRTSHETKFLIKTALQPAGSIWRRKLKQGSEITSSTHCTEEQSIGLDGDATDLDSLSYLEKSVASEIEANELLNDIVLPSGMERFEDGHTSMPERCMYAPSDLGSSSSRQVYGDLDSSISLVPILTREDRSGSPEGWVGGLLPSGWLSREA